MKFSCSAEGRTESQFTAVPTKIGLDELTHGPCAKTRSTAIICSSV